jgi:uncharacterized protein (DUF952 family)
LIYYLLTDEEWQRRRDESVVASPGPDGFVHCCDERQLVAVREKYFPGDVPVLALSIDPTRLEAETRYEPGSSGGPERFAHVYGDVRRADVIGVAEVRSD